MRRAALEAALFLSRLSEGVGWAHRAARPVRVSNRARGDSRLRGDTLCTREDRGGVTHPTALRREGRRGGRAQPPEELQYRIRYNRFCNSAERTQYPDIL